MLETAAISELIFCWILWILAFVKPRRIAAKQQEVKRDSSSIVGIFFVGLGFALVWVRIRPAGFQKSAAALIVSMVLAPLATALAWSATRRLGKQWRMQAALSQDHELIQSGPYAFVRNPIYASMFGLLLAIGAALSWWPLFLAGVISFVIGTEIRIRAEERLLAERFGDSFKAYKARVPAYIPFLR